MSNQAEIDAALDALDFPVDDVIEPIVEPIVETIVEDKPNPPGYIDNIDDWVAAGKDPDLFKNKKMYSAEYDRLQEVKELKSLVQTVVTNTGEWKAQQQAQMEAQIAQARIDAKAALEQARDENDFEAFEAASNKLSNIERQQPQQPVQQQKDPEIDNFIRANPILDQNSDQYDQAFAATMIKAQHTALNRITGGDRNMVVTKEELQGTMRQALLVAKEIYPDKFKSPRNSRNNGGQPVRRVATPSTADYGTRLKAMPATSLNRNDAHANYDLYEMIKAKDVKKAEAFAKTILGDK